MIDLDATLVTSHSDKESAAPTYKRGYGFHPLMAFADHGNGGTGEPVAALLRPGYAGSNTAADHIDVTRKALAQLRSIETMLKRPSILNWLEINHRQGLIRHRRPVSRIT